jgi:hypothetical protein
VAKIFHPQNGSACFSDDSERATPFSAEILIALKINSWPFFAGGMEPASPNRK